MAILIRYSIRVNHGDADITVKYYDIAQNARAFRRVMNALPGVENDTELHTHGPCRAFLSVKSFV